MNLTKQQSLPFQQNCDDNYIWIDPHPKHNDCDQWLGRWVDRTCHVTGCDKYPPSSNHLRQEVQSLGTVHHTLVPTFRLSNNKKISG